MAGHGPRLLLAACLLAACGQTPIAEVELTPRDFPTLRVAVPEGKVILDQNHLAAGGFALSRPAGRAGFFAIGWKASPMMSMAELRATLEERGIFEAFGVKSSRLDGISARMFGGQAGLEAHLEIDGKHRLIYAEWPCGKQLHTLTMSSDGGLDALYERIVPTIACRDTDTHTVGGPRLRWPETMAFIPTSDPPDLYELNGSSVVFQVANVPKRLDVSVLLNSAIAAEPSMTAVGKAGMLNHELDGVVRQFAKQPITIDGVEAIMLMGFIGCADGLDLIIVYTVLSERDIRREVLEVDCSEGLVPPPPERSMEVVWGGLCDTGNATACDYLGDFFSDEDYPQLIDEPRAQALWKKACDLGSETGCTSHKAATATD